MQVKISNLKNRIDKNIDELQKDINLTQNISEAIGRLIEMDAQDSLIKSWIKSTDDIISNIEEKLLLIENS